MSESPGPSASIAFADPDPRVRRAFAGPRAPSASRRPPAVRNRSQFCVDARAHLRQLEILAQPLARLDEPGGQIGDAVLVALAAEHRERALGEVEPRALTPLASSSHPRRSAKNRCCSWNGDSASLEAFARSRPLRSSISRRRSAARPTGGDRVARDLARLARSRSIPAAQRRGRRRGRRRRCGSASRRHLAQHHRLLHRRRHRQKGAFLAEPAQDAAGLALDPRGGAASPGREGRAACLGMEGISSLGLSASLEPSWSRASRSSASSNSGSSRDRLDLAHLPQDGRRGDSPWPERVRPIGTPAVVWAR